MSEMSLTADVNRPGEATSAACSEGLNLGLLYVWATPVLVSDCLLPGIEFGGFNLNGWLWVSMFVAGICLLVSRREGELTETVRQPIVPWLPWFGLLWLSALWCENLRLSNIQQGLQMTMPLLVAAVSSKFIRTEKDLWTLLRMFAWSLLPLGAGILLTRFGLIDNEGTGRRDLALGVALAACVMLAWPTEKPWLRIAAWIGCLVMIVVSESRMAAVAAVVVILFHPGYKSFGRRMMAVAMMAVCGLALFYSPMFQERTFYQGGGTISDLGDDGQVDTAGRSEAWPLIWDEAWKDPIFGKGVGTAHDFTLTVWPGVGHPHNDYLRIGFECGLVGLAFFLAACVWQLADLRRQIERCQGVVRYAFVGGFLGFVVMLITAFTDNTLVYNVCYMNPLFALIGGAYGALAQRTEEDSPT